MDFSFSPEDSFVPGTVLTLQAAGGITGIAFLDRIFFLSDGVMLAQIREIAGVDGSTLQNWVKRGWLPNSVNKRYSKDQFARILIINMLRKNMLLERIDALLRYINGKPDDLSDDIIPESRLYDYVCKLAASPISGKADLKQAAATVCQAYPEKFPGAGKRLQKGLEVIAATYYAGKMQTYAEELFQQL